MWNLNDVVEIGYRKPYVYFVKFNDGLKGEINLEKTLEGGPVFKLLKNIKLFKSARIEGGTIAWPNGADIAPETLYEAIAHPSSPKKIKPRRG